MSKRLLEDYLNEFGLVSAKDTGGIVWKNDDGLQMGVIVGEDDNGDKYVVYNQPSLRIFRVQALSQFKEGYYCYFDFNRKIHNRHKIALKSFELLYQFNEYNNAKYAPDFKLEVPIDSKEDLQTQEFSKGIGAVVYKAGMLHHLEEKVKIGVNNSQSSFRKSINKFTRQLKESVVASFSGVKAS